MESKTLAIILAVSLVMNLCMGIWIYNTEMLLDEREAGWEELLSEAQTGWQGCHEGWDDCQLHWKETINLLDGCIDLLE